MSASSHPLASLDALAGSLRVRPGVASPHNLVSTRSVPVDRLTRGRLAADLPGMLGSLFSLCGHAHRVCACLAIEAAVGTRTARREPVPEALRIETMREHLRRICIDWPRQLGGDEVAMSSAELAASAGVLASCPVFRAGPVAAQTEGLERWLETHLLAMPAEAWLAAWRHDPRACLRSWSGQATTAVAKVMAGCREVAGRPMPGGWALRVHADDATLAALAASLFAEPGFARAPRVFQRHCPSLAGRASACKPMPFGGLGACASKAPPYPQPSPQRGEGVKRADDLSAETGPWARLSPTPQVVCDTPWLRLGARLAELLSLATDTEHEHTTPLMSGCVSTGPNQGLSWVEMARGLLVHAVKLDGQGPAARIQTCHVLAPTDWNFHPHGPVARALAAMPVLAGGPEDATTHRRVRGLMAAYDPCVPYAIETRIEATASTPETNHA